MAYPRTPDGAQGEVLHRFKLAADAERDWRIDAMECTDFRLGKQWPDAIRMDREKDGRPCLTLNRIPEFLAQVENEQRQQRPECRVVSATEGEEAKETAEILEDYTRHIQRRSNADVAYDTAFSCALTGGKGYFRLNLRYTEDAPEVLDESAFDQDIWVEEILNPFAVYFDPASVMFDGSDARYCFIITDMPREEYKLLYPNSEVINGEQFQGEGNNMLRDWIRPETIRVAEYYKLEVERKLVTFGIAGEKKRFVERKSVKWCKTNGVEILEETDVPGTRIPVWPVYGDRIAKNGEVVYTGMVSNARQPQQMYNYWATSATETIALAPRAPYIGAEGQFEGHEQFWATANTRNYPYLQYKPTTAGGILAPPPARQQYDPPIQGAVQMFAMMDGALKSAMRIYNAALGDTGPERSGKAILAQGNQSRLANLNYSDNLARAIESCGRTIVEWIPLVITRERLVQTLSMDGADRMVWLNKPFAKGGVEKVYDVRTGKFYVHVMTGPSYETKRQEAAAAQIEMAKVYPPMMEAAGDIVVGNMDWPQADKVAERLKRIMPPALQDKEDSEIPPQAQAQMAALQQQNQQLTEALNASTQAAETESAKLDSQERIAAMNNEVKLLIAQMQAQQQQGIEMLRAEIAATKHQLDLAFQADRADESRELQEQQMAQAAQAEQPKE